MKNLFQTFRLQTSALSACVLVCLFTSCESRHITPHPTLQFAGVSLETEDLRPVDSAICAMDYCHYEAGRNWNLYISTKFFDESRILLRRGFTRKNDTLFASNCVYHYTGTTKRSRMLSRFKETREELRAAYPDYTFSEGVTENAADQTVDADTNPGYYYTLRKGRSYILSSVQKLTLEVDSAHVIARGMNFIVVYCYSFPIYVYEKK